MSNLNIYFLYDSELAEYEASNKGYRTDVFVEIDSSLYNVRIYTLLRLQQGFESEIESYGFYTVEPNLILVKDSNKKEIIETIKRLYEQKYFDELKPIENVEVGQLIKVY